MLLDDVLPYVLPHTPGCAEPSALQAIRLAAIEFFSESLLWKLDLSPMSTVASQAAYTYVAPTDAAVARLDSLKLAGADIDVVTPAAGRDLIARGTGDTFAYGTLAGFVLNPVPAQAGIEIIPYCSLTPSLSAATLPDALVTTYIEALAAGAIARLKQHKDKTYTDPAGAVAYLGTFDAGISKARSEAASGGAAVVSRTAASWF